MNVSSVNKALNIFDGIGCVPILSTISAVLIRIPMGVVATVAMVFANQKNDDEEGEEWSRIAIYNFVAIFGELIPGLNMIFHFAVNKNTDFSKNARLTDYQSEL